MRVETGAPLRSLLLHPLSTTMRKGTTLVLLAVLLFAGSGMSYAQSTHYRHGLPATRTVIQRPIVDVHAHKAIRELSIQIAPEVQRVFDRFGTVIKAVLNRSLEKIRHFLANLWTEVFADAVAAEWQGQAGLFEPPGTQVLDEMQAKGLADMDAAKAAPATPTTGKLSRRKAKIANTPLCV